MDIYRKLCITKQLGLIIADENVPRAVSKYKYIWEFLPSRMKRIGVFITSRDEGRWKSHGSRVDNRGYRFLYTIHRFFDIHLPKLYCPSLRIEKIFPSLFSINFLEIIIWEIYTIFIIGFSFQKFGITFFFQLYIHEIIYI